MNAARLKRTIDLRATLATISAAIGCAMFAFWPVSRHSLRPITIQAPAVPVLEQQIALDQSAFRVPIWVAEPAPPTAPVAAAHPPPPPLKLQLLAIVKEGETYKAAVYDPDSDRLLVLSAGDKIGVRTVNIVGKSSVTIRDETGTRTLALKDAKESAP